MFTVSFVTCRHYLGELLFSYGSEVVTLRLSAENLMKNALFFEWFKVFEI